MNTEDDEFARIAREQALNKMADNARELGLDYEPAQHEPAPGYCKHCKQYTIEEPLPAQRTWVGLTDEEIQELRQNFATRPAIAAIEAKLKEKNT